MSTEATMEERIRALEGRQQDQEKTATQHAAQLASLEATLTGLIKAVDANTEVLQRHSQILAEYAGVRKFLHWALGIAAAVAGYLMGKHGQ